MGIWRLGRLVTEASVLCLVLVAGSAFAWEFSMEGEFNWKNRLVQQLGSRGFFGKYDLDNSSTPGNFASVNGWVGGKLEDLVSSSGAAEQRMEVNALPELRINPAMRLRGEVPDRTIRRPRSLSLCEFNESWCSSRDL